MSDNEREHHGDGGKKRSTLKRPGLVVAVVAAGVICALGVMYANARSELRQARNDGAAANAAREAEVLVKAIGDHMVLPSEKPTIATVEDVQKLAGQTFFKNAQNGDKVLMYAESKKAILYRPSEDKILEVAYLNIQDSGQ